MEPIDQMRSVSELLGFSRSGLLRGDVPEWLLVLLVVTGLGCLAGGLRLTINWSALRALAADACASLSLIYVVGTVAFIVMAAKAHASGVFMSRYLLPLIPFVLVLVPYGLDLIRFESASGSGRSGLSPGWMRSRATSALGS